MRYFSMLLVLSFLFVNSCQEKQKATTNNKNLDITKSKVKIITFVPHEVLDAVVEATSRSLINEYGIPQSNVEVFNPNGNLDEIRAYVRTLNSRNTDVIISVSTPATQAVLSARHPRIPLVFSFVSDTTSLNLSAQRNVTGISNVLNYEKGFELLKTILPQLSKICVVYNPSEPNSNYSFNQINLYAKKQSPPVEVVSRQFTKDNEISIASSTVNNIDAFYVGGDNKLVKNIKLLLNVANNKKIPVFASDEGSVRAGAIAAYSIDYNAFGTATAKLILEALKNTSSDGLSVILYKEGQNVLNTTSLNNLGIDYSRVKNYVEMK